MSRFRHEFALTAGDLGPLVSDTWVPVVSATLGHDLTLAIRDYWWAKYGWETHGSKLQTQSTRSTSPSSPRSSPTLAGARPVWDALAICFFSDGTKGALLAEGKNYPREMYSSGTGAGKTGSPAALKSRRQIERATAWVQGRLGLPLDPERWLDPLDRTRPSSSLYQTANRLAYTVWLRSQGIDAWLCHLLYVGDPLHHPTSRLAWEQGLAQADQELGIDRLELPFAGHAWLDALDPDTELADLHHSDVPST